MTDLYKLREDHGECYFTMIDGIGAIPWKILNLKDFMKYDSQLVQNRIPVAVIENEIFKNCVLDEFYIRNLNVLNAGVITTVVNCIMLASGPQGPEAIANDLNTARQNINSFFFDAAGLICQTLPSYKLQDVFDLSYKEFCELLMIVEKRLMTIGYLKEPIMPMMANQNVQAVRYENLNTAPVAPSKPQHRTGDFVAPARDRLLESELVTGHDKEDYILWQHDATNGLELIYPELFAKLKAGEKITPDTIKETRGKTNEEVKAKYKKYTEDLLSGKIQHRPTKQIIANKVDVKEKKKKTVKRGR